MIKFQQPRLDVYTVHSRAQIVRGIILARFWLQKRRDVLSGIEPATVLPVPEKLNQINNYLLIFLKPLQM